MCSLGRKNAASFHVARAGDGLKLTPKTPLRERCEEENDDGWHNTHIPKSGERDGGSWGRDRKFVFFFRSLIHLSTSAELLRENEGPQGEFEDSSNLIL